MAICQGTVLSQYNCALNTQTPLALKDSTGVFSIISSTTNINWNCEEKDEKYGLRIPTLILKITFSKMDHQLTKSLMYVEN